MRRLATMILAMLVLTSCAKARVAPITSGFACDVVVQYDQTDYSGELQLCEDGKTFLTFCSPSAVSGLSLVYADDRLTVTYAGMELVLDQSKVPVGAVVRLLGKAFTYAAKQTAVTPSCEIEGDAEGVAYILRFDEQNGMPVLLSAPSYNLTVTFSNWRKL